MDIILETKIMARDESKKTMDTDQQQVEKEKARELTDQELAKVSGGVIKRGGAEKDHGPRRPLPRRDKDLDDLQLER